MMDENVSDHDIATKFALGWLHPYVVNGACDLTLRPSQTTGIAYCFPLKEARWNGSAFTEYLLLELYTPTGLNELDATTAYSYHPQGYTFLASGFCMSMPGSSIGQAGPMKKILKAPLLAAISMAWGPTTPRLAVMAKPVPAIMTPSNFSKRMAAIPSAMVAEKARTPICLPPAPRLP
jgi:hypothetical protein